MYTEEESKAVLGALQRLTDRVHCKYPYNYGPDLPQYIYEVCGALGTSSGCSLNDHRDYKKSLGDYLLKKTLMEIIS